MSVWEFLEREFVGNANASLAWCRQRSKVEAPQPTTRNPLPKRRWDGGFLYPSVNPGAASKRLCLAVVGMQGREGAAVSCKGLATGVRFLRGDPPPAVPWGWVSPALPFSSPERLVWLCGVSYQQVPKKQRTCLKTGFLIFG